MKRVKQLLFSILLWMSVSPINPIHAQTVYIIDTSKQYHVKKCALAKTNSQGITLENALKQGYTPCKTCKSDTVKTQVSTTPAIKISPNGEPGTDNADIYRKTKLEYQKLDTDKELQAWKKYLEKYPKSLFRKQIEARIEELEALTTE